MCLRGALGAGLVAAAFMMGCTPAYKPRFQLTDAVARPDISVVLITVDGLAEPVMDRLLEAGELPHVARLIENGVRVRRAVCSLPSITYSNLTTILTGVHPSRHGVMGNRWFDRYTLCYRDYTTTETYRDADDDIFVPTVYEYLEDDFTVSIQCAVRRGAGRTIDNWATSGIRWFFGGFEAVDQLMPWRFDIIAEEADARGRWPALIHAYFPGVDEIGHQCGCDSRRYRRSLHNVDRQIGLITDSVARAGMSDRTCFILVADHNHTPVPPDHWFDVARWLRTTLGLRVQTEPIRGRTLAERERVYHRVDAVVANGGDRISRIHLKGPAGWHQRPAPGQIDAFLAAVDDLLAHEAVGLVAVRREVSAAGHYVELRSRRGCSRIERQGGPNEWLYRYVVTDRGALDFGEGVDSSWLHSGAGYDASAWLAATADSAYPGAVEQLADLFDSPRAGDIILFAAEGWDFAPGNRGGHGGVGAIDTRVPMVFSGPMIDRAARIDVARLADVTPTILGLLGRRPSGEPLTHKARSGAACVKGEPVHFDGRDWSALLTGAPAPAREKKP